jgi:hypothetical protein
MPEMIPGVNIIAKVGMTIMFAGAMILLLGLITSLWFTK